jgi:hypothetical protein
MEKAPEHILDFFQFDELIFDSTAIQEKNTFLHAPFQIQIPKVSAGWTYFKIIYKTHEMEYRSSDHSGRWNGIFNLLEAVMDILPLIGQKDKYFDSIRTRSRIKHDYETGYKVWDILREDDIKSLDNHSSFLKILIRSNPRTEYDNEEKKLKYFNYYEGGFDDYYGEEVKAEHREDGKLLALKIDARIFVGKLYLCCIEMLDRIGSEKYKQEWGEEFPYELLGQLEQYIKIYLPWKWEFLKNPEEGRSRGGYYIDSTNYGKVRIRNMELASVSELKQRGLLNTEPI